jgi:hypothetical protein
MSEDTEGMRELDAKDLFGVSSIAALSSLGSRCKVVSSKAWAVRNIGSTPEMWLRFSNSSYMMSKGSVSSGESKTISKFPSYT